MEDENVTLVLCKPKSTEIKLNNILSIIHKFYTMIIGTSAVPIQNGLNQAKIVFNLIANMR